MRLGPLFLFSLLATSSLLAQEAVNRREAKEKTSADEQWAQSLSANFAFDFYLATLAKNKDRSFCCSPYSAMNALAMLAHGTSGAGREEFANLWREPGAIGLRNSPWPSEKLLFGLQKTNRAMRLAKSDEERLVTELERIDREIAEFESKRGETDIRFGGAPRPPKVTLSQRERDQHWKAVMRRKELQSLLSKVDLSIANAIWVDQTMPLKKSFVEVAGTNFGATIENADFIHEAAREIDRINVWCSEKTKGKIAKIASPQTVHADTRVVLVNAIYFNAAWQKPFNKQRTSKQNFTMLSGESRKIDIMSDGMPCRYVELRPDGSTNDFKSSRKGDRWTLPKNPDGWKVLELPYRGGLFALILVLPNRKDGLPALEDKLTRGVFDEWAKNLKSDRAVVAMPRFKLESNFDLHPILQSLGLNAIFQSGSLLGLSDAREARVLFVDSAIQKTYLDLNEEGTEAAAVTAIGGVGGGGPSKPVPEFIADHPFLFLIRHQKTGAILFMGRFTGAE